MKTLTIRGIDDELSRRIKERSGTTKKSINQIALNILKSSLGIGDQQTFPKYTDLDHLVGTWTEKDKNQFFNQIKELGEVDKELWK